MSLELEFSLLKCVNCVLTDPYVETSVVKVVEVRLSGGHQDMMGRELPEWA